MNEAKANEEEKNALGTIGDLLALGGYVESEKRYEDLDWPSLKYLAHPEALLSSINPAATALSVSQIFAEKAKRVTDSDSETWSELANELEKFALETWNCEDYLSREGLEYL